MLGLALQEGFSATSNTNGTPGYRLLSCCNAELQRQIH